MTGFLFRELSDKDREEIKVEAEKIMSSFGEKLESAKNLPSEADIERGTGYRKEGNGILPDKVLKERILDNAPKKNKDFIIAERKKW